MNHTIFKILKINQHNFAKKILNCMTDQLSILII